VVRDEVLAEFPTETGEHLYQIDVELVRFEREPNDAAILKTIFRLVHTVKGTRGFLGLDRLAKLAHAAETLMGQYRDGASAAARLGRRIGRPQETAVPASQGRRDRAAKMRATKARRGKMRAFARSTSTGSPPISSEARARARGLSVAELLAEFASCEIPVSGDLLPFKAAG
jgi:chemotaxis protein histidine kinase CheA